MDTKAGVLMCVHAWFLCLWNARVELMTEPAPRFLPLYVTDLKRLALAAVIGLGVGLGAAATLQMTCGLYFWFEEQTQALGLIALTLALPLGAACGGSNRHTLARGLGAGLGLALGVALTSGFLTHAMSWYGAAALLGAAYCGISRKLALPVSLFWMTLCALPFFFEKLATTPVGRAAQDWGATGSPWLGFAQNVFITDPLHKTFLYFNQLSGLSNLTQNQPLDASSLWLLALLGMAAALLRPGKAP
jgi:hypothetical protein